MFVELNKKAVNKRKNMNALASMFFLLFFLTSVFTHAQHLTEQAITVEQQECHICHQGIDLPPELPQTLPLCGVSYDDNSYQVISNQFKANYFVNPQLRAPPKRQ